MSTLTYTKKTTTTVEEKVKIELPAFFIYKDEDVTEGFAFLEDGTQCDFKIRNSSVSFGKYRFHLDTPKGEQVTEMEYAKIQNEAIMKVHNTIVLL